MLRVRGVFSSFHVRLVSLFVGSGLLLVMIALEVDRSAREFRDAAERVTATMTRRDEIGNLLSALRAAQSAQRGYLLTGLDRELAEYFTALAHVGQAREWMARSATHEDSARRSALQGLVDRRLAILGRVLDVRRAEGLPASISLVATGEGGEAMVAVERAAADLLQDYTDRLVAQSAFSQARSVRMRLVTPAAIALCGALLAATLALTWFEQRRRRRAESELQLSALQLAQSVGEAHKLAEDLRGLSEFAEMLQSCQSLDEAFGGARSAFSAFLPAAGGRLALINASQNLVAIGAHWGQHRLLAESIFSPEECWALRRGQAHPSAGRHDGVSCPHVHYPNPEDPPARYLCLPLAAQGVMLGVLTLDFEGELAENQRRLAIAATDHLALAIANIRLQQDLRSQSIRDPLTGLFNRRYLEASLDRELARAVRRQQSVAVLMMDIDHFKRFNDTFGHEAGDHVLSAFGQALASKCRGEDTCCRFGGEEFTAILVDCDARCALARGEMLRKMVQEMDLVFRGQRLGPISVSIGVAVFPDHGASPQQLVAAADLALYAAKHAGRDRVRMADTAPAADDART